MKVLSSMFAGSFGLNVKGRHLHPVVLLLAFMAFVASSALAQDATIVGTVTDASGAVVPNAVVTFTNVDTGTTRSLTTSADGQYAAPSVAIGRYTARAEAKGFKVAEQKGIVLNVAERARVDFKLEIGNVQETISVEANAVAVQTDTGEVSTLITGAQVANLSTNGRSLYTLFALTPGASSIQSARVGFTPVSGDSNVSINGQRAGHNLQLLDGGENLDRGGSSASVMPSIDAIAEFNNITSNYSAEYGLSSAATITTAVKSGTKTFHASAWEFFRNDALNARNYFKPAPLPVTELRYNVYGFNVGGQVPLWKEHPTFFFYNMEWRKEIDGGATNQVVPDTANYGGNFGTTLITVPTAAQLSPEQQQRFTDDGLVLGNPFPNNIIPDDLIDQNAKNLLNYGIFPANNSVNLKGQPQFSGGANAPTNLREEIARIDHQFTPKFSVFGHWVSEQISQTYATTQWSGDNVPTVGDVFGNPSYSAVVHTTYVISPTLLNEAAFNYNGNRINIIPFGLTDGDAAGFAFNRLFTGPNAGNRIPSINLTGLGTNYTSNWTPWINKADDFQLRDDISWTRGAHQLKFGFSWSLYQKGQDAFANSQGNFKFDGSFTGNDFADFLLGYAQNYNEDAFKIHGQWNNVSYAAYVQDNWRVNKRLTLNLGLRWDGVPHTYEANQQSTNFYPNLYDFNNAATFDSQGHICSVNSNPACPGGPSPALGTSPNPILAGVQFYTNGIRTGGKDAPKGLVDNHWANFGPRLGFAYDVTGQGKTVVRGGFGIMYERIQGNDMYNGATNPPGNFQPTLNNVSLSNPGLGITSGDVITAADLPVLPLGITGIAQPYKPSSSYQFSLGVQQALGQRAVLGVSYVGSQNRHLNDYRAINLPPIEALPAMVAANSLDNTQVQYLGFGGIRLSENEVNSHYNSLQVDLHGHVARDLQLQFGYTYSRAIDATTSNGSGGDLQNVTNPYVGWRYDVGPSQFDRTHNAFVNFVYDIPVFKNADNHFVKAALGGWQMSGIVTFQTGAPIDLGVVSQTIDGVKHNVVNGVLSNIGNRPDVIGKISYPKKPGQWFDTSAFAIPACQTGPDCWGNLGFDGLRGPGRQNWDLTLLKTFAFTERFRMQFRADGFNIWNHTNFNGDKNNGGIGLNQGSGNFGVISKAFDGRQFQLALKLMF
jgi:Carboxypeptidase regulatory-like domain